MAPAPTGDAALRRFDETFNDPQRLGVAISESIALGEGCPRRIEQRDLLVVQCESAREVARGDPTALVVASLDRELAEAIQSAFSGPTFRLYTSPDPVGVEVGGSVKNVVAIGAGVCHGLGFGSNALAALITRGLAEISRFDHPKPFVPQISLA